MSDPDITRAIVQQVDELTEKLIERNKRIADLEAEVERLRLLLNRVKGTERSTGHDDVLVRFSNQDWDEIREWAQ